MDREAVFGRLLSWRYIGLIDLRMPGKTHCCRFISRRKRDFSFEAFWCLIAQCGMESLPVVVVFDKLGDVLAQVFEISVFVCPDFFLLQRLHKALTLRVVPGIRQTAHACNDSVLVQNISVFGRGILNSPI